MHPRQLRAYLVQTAINKALDSGKSAERTRTEPLGDGALEATDLGNAPDELAAARFDDARVREIVGELPPRQQTVVKLRFFFDRTPDEIQQLLGMSERTYRRELERALRALSEGLSLLREGRLCETRASLIRAYVAGVAGPGREKKAREHLASCPGCARWAAELAAGAERAAALLPFPGLVAGAHGSLDGAPRWVEGLRERTNDLLASVKQHVMSLVARADPSAPHYALAARPGAAAAAVAGCLAIGGGATYCVLHGVDIPHSALAPGHTPAARHAKKPKPKPKPIVNARASERPPASVRSQSRPVRAPQPRRAQPRSSTPPTRSQGGEFAVESSVKAGPEPKPSRAPPSSSSSEFGP
jgi:Sigma-70, region 4